MHLFRFIPFFMVAVISACSSSGKRADISATANPSEEIARVEGAIKEGYVSQFDVLANEDFTRSQKFLDEAKSDLANGQGQSEIIKDIAQAEGSLNEARQKSSTRAAQIPAILEARQKALTEGAREFPPTRKQLADVDEDVREEADSFTKLNAEKTSALQARYMDLELAAITNTQLGKAQAQVNGASKAKSYSPKSLKRAELDLLTATNLIRANRNSSGAYSEAVAKANESARLLTLVLAATKGGDVDENTAISLVGQTDKIANLEGELDTAAAKGERMDATVARQGELLNANAKTINLQKSIESARKEFTKDEADVFQQGDRLLIRLKSMNFASGGAALPEAALGVLAKVKTVASDLGPKAVLVEGHTDSTGDASVNQKLSQQRASAVAKYLETNGIEESSIKSAGYGYRKPIATNKSQAGRSQNRRVDIIITPGTPSI